MGQALLGRATRWPERAFTGQCHDHVGDQSSNTAIAIFGRGVELDTGDQSQDGFEVEETHVC